MKIYDAVRSALDGPAIAMIKVEDGQTLLWITGCFEPIHIREGKAATIEFSAVAPTTNFPVRHTVSWEEETDR